MLNIPELLTTEFKLNSQHVTNALALQAEGGTIPFIARSPTLAHSNAISYIHSEQNQNKLNGRWSKYDI